MSVNTLPQSLESDCVSEPSVSRAVLFSTPQVPVSTDPPSRFKYLDIMELWRIYKSESLTARGLLAREEMLKRHNETIVKVATMTQNKLQYVGGLDDFIQWARIGAMGAYDGYDPNRGATLETYVINRVRYYLYECMGDYAMVKCPDHMVAIKGYFSGKYCQKRKREIERRMGWRTREQISAAQASYTLLIEGFTDLSDDSLESKNKAKHTHQSNAKNCYHMHEDQILTGVKIHNVLQGVLPRQQEVFALVFEQQYTIKEAAQILSSSYPGTSEKNVQADIRCIRMNFIKAAKEEEEDEAKLNKTFKAKKSRRKNRGT